MKNINDDVISELRKAYEKGVDAQRVFDWLATLSNDAKETNISRISTASGISYGAAVRVMKLLEGLDCGKFVSGRKGHQSRFVWRYSRVSLGKAASGEISDLQESIEDCRDDDVADVDGITEFVSMRARMAEALGIDVAKLQITILG